jgi:polysaccharide pyruvyl transferase WcaK-like protein
MHPGGLKVCVVNCAADHNKGIAAIVWGLLNRLRRSGLVGETTVLSSEREPTPADHRHVATAFPDLRILPAPIERVPEPRLFQASAPKAAVALGEMARAARVSAMTLGVLTPSLRKRAREGDASVQALAESDLVLTRGGAFIAAEGPPPNPTLQLAYWPLLFARQEGISYGISGEGIGSLNNPWARWLTRSVLSDAVLVGVRDELSRRVLIDAGLRPDAVITMLDNAFWVEPGGKERVESILGREGLSGSRFLAVTSRPWTKSTKYPGEFAAAIDLALQEDFDRVVVVPNALHPDRLDPDDRAESHRLVGMLAEPDRAVVIEDDLGPDELATLYGAAKLVVGTRLHSAILALIGGAPVVAVSYSPKAEGIMGLLGLDPFVLPINTLDRRQALEVMRRAVEEQHTVPARLAELRRHGDLILEATLRRITPGIRSGGRHT